MHHVLCSAGMVVSNNLPVNVRFGRSGNRSLADVCLSLYHDISACSPSGLIREMPVWAFVVALAIGRKSMLVPAQGLICSLCSVPLCDSCGHDTSHHESASRVEVRLPSIVYERLILSLLLHSVITELIIGYALPGRPIAMMMFKTYGYITMSQALTFTSDFKLGHYMKIPPRPMFCAQVVATMLAGTVQLAVQAWMFDHIP